MVEYSGTHMFLVALIHINYSHKFCICRHIRGVSTSDGVRRGGGGGGGISPVHELVSTQRFHTHHTTFI